MTPTRQPSLYLSHGGGPSFWIDFPPPLGPGAFDRLRHYLAGLLGSLAIRPSAILVISAHWEEERPTLGSSAAPSMLFDYYGFPEHTYALNYPAPGSPDLAARAQHMLTTAGIPASLDATRGFDHGVFVPFLIIDPAARIPVVTLSLQQDLDPAFHIKMGKALKPLRDENVLIVGSGNSYHNLSEFFDGDPHRSSAFDGWLSHTLTVPDAHQRARDLESWTSAPFARACHPREEHLLPLMVAVGAAGSDRGHLAFRDVIGGKTISCYLFGET